MLTDDGTPVVMDLGSADKARMEIKTLREATTLQVSSSLGNVLSKVFFTIIASVKNT
jgi:hypothetical protein